MPLYIVKVEASAYEYYVVDATDEAGARANWDGGARINYEVWDSEVVAVTLADE